MTDGVEGKVWIDTVCNRVELEINYCAAFS